MPNNLSNEQRSDLKYDYDVFISYSSKDRGWVANELIKRIENTNFRVFIDFRDFTPGKTSINNCLFGVETCRIILLILTPAYIQSGWCEIENVMAQTIDPANRGLRIIPLLKEPCQIPLHIAAFNYIDFTDGANHELAWNRLFKVLGKPLESPQSVNSPNIMADTLNPVLLAKELIVADDGSAHCRTISEALARIMDGGLIKIRSGYYQESLEITKSVTLVSVGPTEVCIQAIGKWVVSIVKATVLFRNIAIHGISPKSVPSEGGVQQPSYAIICQESVVAAEKCRIISDSGSALLLDGDGNSLVLRSCQIQADMTVFSLTGSSDIRLDECSIKTSGAVVWAHKLSRIVAIKSTVAGSSIYMNDQSKWDFRNSQINCKFYCSEASSLFFEDSEVTYDQTVFILQGSTKVKLLNTKIAGVIDMSDYSRLEAVKCQFVSVCSHSDSFTLVDTAFLELLSCGVETRNDGINMSDNSKSVVNDTRFLSTGLPSSSSKAVCVWGVADLRLNQCKFQDFNCGARLFEAGIARITFCQFNGAGGITSAGISVSDKAKPQIDHCDFQGFIYGADLDDNSKAQIENCKFLGPGGMFSKGIKMSDGNKSIIRYCKISGYGSDLIGAK